NGSGRSISLLTVTPSLVTVGPPKLLSRITLRPVGPSVMPTACASLSAPVSSFFRASSVYSNCFAIYWVSDSRSQAQPGNASLGGSASFSVPACLFFSRRSLHDFRENVSLAHDLQ